MKTRYRCMEILRCK